MTDLVQKLVGALEMVDRAVYIDDSGNACLNASFNDEQLQAALSEAKAGGWVAVPVEPVAWMRKWAHEGETPQKTRNENGRTAWPVKFKFLPVTQGKCMSDDVPLYAPLPAPPAQRGEG